MDFFGARVGAGVGAGVLAVALLSGCSAPAAGGAGASLKEGCERLWVAYGEVADSLELVGQAQSREAAVVHLDAAEGALEAVGEAPGPAGEFQQLRESLVVSTGQMLAEGRRVLDGGDPAAGERAQAEVGQALMAGKRLCGWPE